MLEVRPFEGSAEELTEFVVSTWKSIYAGQMAVPLWSSDYFCWQLGLEQPERRRYLHAVYQKGRLAGLMPEFPADFELHGKRCSGVQASWLSVPAEFRGQGVARLLADASREQLRSSGQDFRVGYAYYGSRASRGPGFWKKDVSTQFLRPVGFWTRILQPARVAEWNLNRVEAVLARIASPLIRVPEAQEMDGVIIRPANEDDLESIERLANDCTSGCDFRLIWNRDQLRRQLGLSGYSQSLVTEQNGKVTGCIAWHLLPVQARTVEVIGVLDLMFVHHLSAGIARRLMDHVLRRMYDADAIVALKLRSGDYPLSGFLRLGWVWKPADSSLLIHWAGDRPPQTPVGKFHLLWR